jgi:predicted phage terminase large subunit-like protein
VAVADELDLLADQLTETTDRYPTPGALARAIEPRTVQTPALDLLDQALIDSADGTAPRLLFTMAPQEGKSQRVSRWFVLWLLLRNPDLRIGIVSYSDALARRWGRQVRNDIESHPELGLTVRRDTRAANEWQLEGHDGGVVTVGIGGSLTGRPLEALILDDLLKGRKEADSEIERENVKDFWRTTGSMRLAEDAPVVSVSTRWHEDDFTGWQLAEDPDGWRYINIPALAEHKPEQGETDPLGRQPGEWMASARGRTIRGWLRRKRDAGARGFAALFQGKPSPAEGNILKRGWWQYSPVPRAVQKADGSWWAIGATQVIQSWDLAFKDNKTSDWVVGQVWARRGSKAWLLDQVRDHMDLPTTLDAIKALSAKWPQARLKLIEDKANGPAVIQSLRGVIGGIVPVTPKDSKVARASAVSPFIEGGDVELPAPAHAPWVAGFVDECAGFPNGTHDDQVDTATQALERLLLGGDASGDFMDELVREGRAGDVPIESLRMPLNLVGRG